MLASTSDSRRSRSAVDTAEQAAAPRSTSRTSWCAVAYALVDGDRRGCRLQRHVVLMLGGHREGDREHLPCRFDVGIVADGDLNDPLGLAGWESDGATGALIVRRVRVAGIRIAVTAEDVFEGRGRVGCAAEANRQASRSSLRCGCGGGREESHPAHHRVGNFAWQSGRRCRGPSPSRKRLLWRRRELSGHCPGPTPSRCSVLSETARNVIARPSGSRK